MAMQLDWIGGGRRFFVTILMIVCAVMVLRWGARDLILRQAGYVFLAEPEYVQIHLLGNEVAVDVTVSIRSISTTPVRIVGVASSCSCLAPGSQFPLTLQPGKKHEVHFKLSISDKIRQEGGQAAQVTFFSETQCPPVAVTFNVVAGAGRHSPKASWS
jgi:hypothetical protein